MFVRIEVTSHMLVAGRRGSCTACPVALAIAAAFNDACFVTVDSRWLRINLHVPGGSLAKQDKMFAREMPPSVRRFVKNFDTGCRVDPVSFSLRMDDDHKIFLREMEHEARHQGSQDLGCESAGVA